MITNKQIRKIVKNKNGIFRTADFLEQGFHNRLLNVLLRENKIIRLKRGLYQWIGGGEAEEAAVLCRLFPDAVLCMNSALYYHSYTDRTPERWHLAVDKDSNKSRFRIEYPLVKPYYITKEFMKIGVTSGEINGVPVKIFNKERTICDVLRYANKLDNELVNKAIQSFLSDRERNVRRLLDYAKKMRVYKKVQRWLGVWI